MDEGLLYQRIMAVPGLSGTWKQRLAQYYKALTGKTYQGTASEGNYMISQISARNFPQAPDWNKPAQAQVQAPAPVNPATQAAQEIVPQVDFREVLPWEQYFDPNLAKSSIAQRTARYYDPLVQSSQQGIESDYASRGLTRSGARSTSLLDMYKEMADQEATMREQLYGTREKEAREGYGLQQSLYEESPKGYQKTTYSNTPYEYQYPEESPQKYAKSYRDWLRASYNM